MFGSAQRCSVRVVAEPLEQFEANWLSRLNQGAKTRFHCAAITEDAGLYSAVADGFVAQHGYAPIGFNWELLDAQGTLDSPRAALGEITKALAHDISNPSQSWLGERMALKCAQELLSGFDGSKLTVVSNRYDGLWNPISQAQVEWGFVCFDDKAIALLLISEPT